MKRGRSNENLVLEPVLKIKLDAAPAAAAATDESTAYVPLKSGRFVAIDLDRGTIRWSVDLVTSQPAAVSDALQAARRLADEEGIGSHLSIDHLAPAGAQLIGGDAARHELADIGDAKAFGQITDAGIGPDAKTGSGSVGTAARKGKQLHAASIGSAPDQGSLKYRRLPSRSRPAIRTALMTRPMGTMSRYQPFAASTGMSSRTGGRPARIGTGKRAMPIANR